MADVNMGLSVYDYNLMIMKQLPILETEEGIQKIKEKLVKYLENSPAEQYLMLLCREKNDYTLFNFANSWSNEDFPNDILECFQNRGVGIISLEIIDNGVAVEIWVKRPGQMEEADLYYLFPADEMVIEY